MWENGAISEVLTSHTSNYTHWPAPLVVHQPAHKVLRLPVLQVLAVVVGEGSLRVPLHAGQLPGLGLRRAVRLQAAVTQFDSCSHSQLNSTARHLSALTDTEIYPFAPVSYGGILRWTRFKVEFPDLAAHRPSQTQKDFLYLALSSASSRGSCQLLWKKPRTRRIPAREWMLLMVTTCTRERESPRIRSEISGGCFTRIQLTVSLSFPQRSALSSSACVWIWLLRRLRGLFIRRGEEEEVWGPLRWDDFYHSARSTCYPQPIRHGAPSHRAGSTSRAFVQRGKVPVKREATPLRCQDQTSAAHPVKQNAGTEL